MVLCSVRCPLFLHVYCVAMYMPVHVVGKCYGTQVLAVKSYNGTFSHTESYNTSCK